MISVLLTTVTHTRLNTLFSFAGDLPLPSSARNQNGAAIQSLSERGTVPAVFDLLQVTLPASHDLVCSPLPDGSGAIKGNQEVYRQMRATI